MIRDHTHSAPTDVAMVLEPYAHGDFDLELRGTGEVRIRVRRGVRPARTAGEWDFSGPAHLLFDQVVTLPHTEPIEMRRSGPRRDVCLRVRMGSAGGPARSRGVRIVPTGAGLNRGRFNSRLR